MNTIQSKIEFFTITLISIAAIAAQLGLVVQTLVA